MIRALILRKQETGEADELVLFFGRELGRLRGIAKNAKKSRIRFGGNLEPLSLVELSLRARRKDDLVWIDESQAINGFLRIRANWRKFAVASYFLELASMLSAEAHPDPALFDFLENVLVDLDSHEHTHLQLFVTELKLLGLLGYAPQLDRCVACTEDFKTTDAAVFDVTAGGAVHARCLGSEEPRASAHQIPLSLNILITIRKAMDAGEKALKRLRLGKTGSVELRSALSAFVRSIAGREVNTLVFMEKLGMWD